MRFLSLFDINDPTLHVLSLRALVHIKRGETVKIESAGFVYPDGLSHVHTGTLVAIESAQAGESIRVAKTDHRIIRAWTLRQYIPNDYFPEGV